MHRTLTRIQDLLAAAPDPTFRRQRNRVLAAQHRDVRYLLHAHGDGWRVERNTTGRGDARVLYRGQCLMTARTCCRLDARLRERGVDQETVIAHAQQAGYEIVERPEGWIARAPTGTPILAAENAATIRLLLAVHRITALDAEDPPETAHAA